mmetsp:Transcript_133486/g.285427  ORF Transcript_133486/g.285427 Transcript_133486/m.285427 type:complete len:219 (-) Transcript_133486:106-762(-)
MRAEALLRIRRASEVGLGGLVADARARLLRNLRQPLVSTVHTAAIASTNTTAVQQVLDGEGDVDALSLPGDLDAVPQGRDGPVRPARAAVLGNVLVPGDGAIVHAILVAPVEVLGHLFIPQELLVRVRRIPAPDNAHGLRVLAAQELVAVAASRLRGSAIEDARGEALGILLRETAARHSPSRAPSALGVRDAGRLGAVGAPAGVILGPAKAERDRRK